MKARVSVFTRAGTIRLIRPADAEPSRQRKIYPCFATVDKISPFSIQKFDDARQFLTLIREIVSDESCAPYPENKGRDPINYKKRDGRCGQDMDGHILENHVLQHRAAFRVNVQ